LVFAAGNGDQRSIRVVVELPRLTATTPTMTTATTTTPTIIHVHGIVVVVVVVVVVVASPVAAFGAVADEPPALEPVVVDVVLEPLALPPACAKVITGAIARNSVKSTRLSRRIGRMWLLPLNQVKYTFLPRKANSESRIVRSRPCLSSDVDISKHEENHERDNEDARDAKSARAICAAIVVVAAASK